MSKKKKIEEKKQPSLKKNIKNKSSQKKTTPKKNIVKKTPKKIVTKKLKTKKQTSPKRIQIKPIQTIPNATFKNDLGVYRMFISDMSIYRDIMKNIGLPKLKIPKFGTLTIKKISGDKESDIGLFLESNLILQESTVDVSGKEITIAELEYLTKHNKTHPKASQFDAALSLYLDFSEEISNYFDKNKFTEPEASSKYYSSIPIGDLNWSFLQLQHDKTFLNKKDEFHNYLFLIVKGVLPTLADEKRDRLLTSLFDENCFASFRNDIKDQFVFQELIDDDLFYDKKGLELLKNKNLMPSKNQFWKYFNDQSKNWAKGILLIPFVALLKHLITTKHDSIEVEDIGEFKVIKVISPYLKTFQYGLTLTVNNVTSTLLDPNFRIGFDKEKLLVYTEYIGEGDSSLFNSLISDKSKVYTAIKKLSKTSTPPLIHATLNYATLAYLIFEQIVLVTNGLEIPEQKIAFINLNLKVWYSRLLTSPAVDDSFYLFQDIFILHLLVLDYISEIDKEFVASILLPEELISK